MLNRIDAETIVGEKVEYFSCFKVKKLSVCRIDTTVVSFNLIFAIKYNYEGFFQYQIIPNMCLRWVRDCSSVSSSIATFSIMDQPM